MYTIKVAVSGKHHHLSVKQQKSRGPKKPDFQITFIVHKETRQLNKDQKIHLRSSNEVWNSKNLENVARGLLNFFLETKFASFTSWTSFWHVQDVKEGIKVYKMYDCNLAFLQRNSELYLRSAK